MMDNDFEKAYGDYLESMAYEETENLLFSVLRNAFLAGWQAAGGSTPIPARIFEILGGNGRG